MGVVKDRLELITRGLWDYNDIMAYFPHIKSATTAIEIKKKAQKYFDGNSYSDRYVTVDAVCKYMKLDRESEIDILRKAIDIDEKVEEELH